MRLVARALLRAPPMRTRLLLAFALILSSAGAAFAQRVLHVNAEVVRQRTASGIHDVGSEQVATWLAGRGASVTRVQPGDLAARGRTRLDLRRLGRPDLVTISATMAESRLTVTWIVKGLKAQGVPGSRIVVGGRAMTAGQAATLGVNYAPAPGPVLDAILRASRPILKR